MYYHQFEIRGIKIVLVGDEQGLSRLMIDNGTKPLVMDSMWELSEKPFHEAQKQLIEYFEGGRKSFDLNLNPSGTDYQKQVWEVLRQIPYAKLFSYKQVAVMLGNPGASRAVGMANNRNPIPIIIPCHRVLGTNKKTCWLRLWPAIKTGTDRKGENQRCFWSLGQLLWQH